MVPRLLKFSKSHSFFLFGARATGKTELLKSHFSDEEAVWVDLLDPELSSRLSAYPNELLEMILPHKGRKPWVVIDEVQKVPELLDVVHKQIAEKNFLFALTGSSARKLRRGGANMLAGRAFVFNLFPLTHKELAENFELEVSLSFGGLPDIHNFETDADRRRMLKAYAQTYVQEEIVAEQLLRNLPPFRRFLEVAAAASGEILSFTNIAKTIGSDPKTVSRYYDVLADTLLGIYVPSYGKTVRAQQRKAKRFYLFDTGVARVLAGKVDQPLLAQTQEYGKLFENFIVNEIHSLLTYGEKQFKLSYLRVSETQEIDLIVEIGTEELFLLEIKSSKKIDDRAARSLKSLSSCFKNPKLRILSNDPTPKQFGEVSALHWKQGIAEICGSLK